MTARVHCLAISPAGRRVCPRPAVDPHPPRRAGFTTSAALVDPQPPDLVVAYCSGMARFALEPPLVDLPFVLDMVDVDSVKWTRSRTCSRSAPLDLPPRGANAGAFERIAAERARASLVVNERERDALRALTPAAHVDVVPNGVDLDAFAAPGAAAEPTGGLFCGVMDYAPNVDAVDLVRANMSGPAFGPRGRRRVSSISGSDPGGPRAWAACADPPSKSRDAS